MRDQNQPDGAGPIFTIACGLMVAHRIAGKAVRDGLFLSRFAPSDLPKIVVASALAAVLLGLLRLVPLAFAGDESDDQYGFRDEILKNRPDESLEYGFSLFALELPGEPLKVAFRALHSDDSMLRGLALEYLESNLSEKIVVQLADLAAPGRVPRAQEEVLDELMASRQSILLSLGMPSAEG